MKKTHVILMVATVFVAALVLSTAYAGGHKYQKRETMRGKSAGASGEATMSMSDCMTFCAGFSCAGGSNKAKADFERQFGDPIDVTGRVTTYSYDNYTNVILDCSGRCYCRCLTK